MRKLVIVGSCLLLAIGPAGGAGRRFDLRDP